MVIYVSDFGVFKSSSNYIPSNTAASRVNSVEKVSEKTSQSAVREAEKDYVIGNTPAYNISISSMGKAAVAALQTLSKNMNVPAASKQPVTTNLMNHRDSVTDNTIQMSAVKNYSNQTDRIQTDSKQNAGIQNDSIQNDSIQNDLIKNDTTGTVGTDEVTNHKEQDTSESSKNNSKVYSNLTGYSEAQLRNLASDGSITKAEMYDELNRRNEPDNDIKMNQAIAAYKYQMQGITEI